MSAPQEVIFLNKRNPGFRVGADDIQMETRFTNGQIHRRSHVIEFVEGEYRTVDPKIMKIIRALPEYQRGIITEVSQDEISEHRGKRAKQLTSQTSSIPGEAEQSGPTDFDSLGYGQTVGGGVPKESGSK